MVDTASPWLIDEQLDVGLFRCLESRGIKAVTAEYVGLDGIDNGVLLAEAFRQGFRVILTGDKRFEQASHFNSATYPDLAIVLIHFNQSPPTTFEQRFLAAWDKEQIRPVPGQVIRWPAMGRF